MSQIIREHGLVDDGLRAASSRSIGVHARVAPRRAVRVVNNDSSTSTRAIESNRFGLILTSVPFGNHYEYSASYNDFGHNPTTPRSSRQMDFLTPHCCGRCSRAACWRPREGPDPVRQRDRLRHAERRAVPRRLHRALSPHGFIYFGMITVVTDVVRENNQTYRLGWSEQCKDGTKMGVGSPEYVLLFRKLPTDTSKGYADVRVAKSKDEYTAAAGRSTRTPSGARAATGC
jgi:hypothetical protein